jgi:dihydrofolate reductase
MIGIMLVSSDWFCADDTGDVSWGPAKDKQWVKEFITGKTVLVGYSTFMTISKFPKLLALAKTWYVPTYDRIYGFKNVASVNPLDDLSPLAIEVNFGGVETFKKYSPAKLIIHQAMAKLNSGYTFPVDFLNGYELANNIDCGSYLEYEYVKK